MIAKKNYLLLILFIISAILRLYKLGEMPPGFTNDEIGFVTNASSIAQTGHDIYGRFLPVMPSVSTKPYPPITVYLIAAVVKLLGITPFTARLAGALSGIIEVIVVYMLAQWLFKSNKIAFFSGLVLSISPWHLQFTRSAYDTVISLLFYLLGVYLFLVKRNWGVFYLSLIAFVLAIFSYRAMNIIFVPITLSLLWFSWPVLRKEKQKLILYSIGILGVIVLSGAISYFSMKNGGLDYFGEVSRFFDANTATKSVDSEITNSKAPIIIARIFSNKPLYYIRNARDNYLSAFSTQYLFLGCEGSGVYCMWFRGVFYTIELPLFIFGVAYLYQKNKRSALFVFLSILIGPLPSAISGGTYSARALYMLPYFAISIGGGIAYVVEVSRQYRKIKRYFILIALIITYVVQFTGYLYQYYARYSIYGAESWFKSSRDLSEYLHDNQNLYEKIIVANGTDYDLLQYYFWTKRNPWAIQKSLINETKMQSDQIDFENITFKRTCLNNGEGSPSAFLAKDTLYITHDLCHKNATPSAEIKESGSIRTIWKIYYSTVQ